MVVLDLILIGLAVTLEPIPITAFILILSAERGIIKGLVFVLTWLGSLVLIVTAVELATGGNPPRSNSDPSTAGLALKLAVGVALILVGVRQHRRMGRPRKPPTWMKKLDHLSLWTVAGLSFFVQPWPLVAAGAATSGHGWTKKDSPATVHSDRWSSFFIQVGGFLGRPIRRCWRTPTRISATPTASLRARPAVEGSEFDRGGLPPVASSTAVTISTSDPSHVSTKTRPLMMPRSADRIRMNAVIGIGSRVTARPISMRSRTTIYAPPAPSASGSRGSRGIGGHPGTVQAAALLSGGVVAETIGAA